MGSEEWSMGSGECVVRSGEWEVGIEECCVWREEWALRVGCEGCG